MKLRSTTAVVAVSAAVLLGLSGAADGATGAGSRSLAASAQLAPPSFQPPTENLYVPITPCRIVDTRAGTGTGGTPFTPLQTRTYYVSGTFGFSAQGGKSGGCGIPGGAVALAATFLTVGPTKGGRFQAWPNGATEPTATTFYYPPFTSSTGTTVTINANTAYSMKVRNYSATADLVIDVTGYYVKPMAVLINPSGELYAGSSRANVSSRVSEGVYRVRFDRTVVNCTVVATAYLSNFYANADSYTGSASNDVQIEVFDAAGAPTDQYVYVHVIC